MRSPARQIQAAAADWVARRDAGLSQSETAELQTWLATDPRHREALTQCDLAWGALDRPFQAGAANDLLGAVHSRVRSHRRRRLTLMAAGLAVLLTTSFIWRSSLPPGDSSELRRSEAPVVMVPAKQILPDGSLVELNSAAEVTTEFGVRQRRVVLHKGEAHFQVAKDSSRPFVVVVGSVEVRAVGTAFVVQRGDAQVEIVVTQGEVAVDKHWEPLTNADAPAVGDAVAAPQTMATLAVNHRAVIGISADDRSPPEVEVLASKDVSERMAWRAPRLEFSGTPLSEAVALLNENADKAAAAGQPARRYIIGDPEIASMRVSGLFRVDNTDSFVRLLQHGFGIEAEQRDGSAEIVLRQSR